jgi:cytochrome c5
MKNSYLIWGSTGLLALCSCGDKPQESVSQKPIYEVPAKTPELEAGRQVWLETCKACHAQGISGAPIIGNKTMWGPRIAKGEATLFKHAIEGWESDVGNHMPAKGGNAKLSEDEVKSAVRFVMSVSQ